MSVIELEEILKWLVTVCYHCSTMPKASTEEMWIYGRYTAILAATGSSLVINALTISLLLNTFEYPVLEVPQPG